MTYVGLKPLFAFVLTLTAATFLPLKAHARCVVIDGLKEDTDHQFQAYENSFEGCTVFRSMGELMKAGIKNEVIDLRIVTHGKKDGSLICEANSDPSEVVKSLNELSKTNKVFSAFNSCYSDLILKERILFDSITPRAENHLLDSNCLYAASTAQNQASIEPGYGEFEKSMGYFQLLMKDEIKGKKVNEIFTHTTTGVLSATPFDQAGITEYWKNGPTKTAVTSATQAFTALKTDGAPPLKCLSVEMCKKLDGGTYFELSDALETLRHIRASRLMSIKPDQMGAYVDSYARLMANPGTHGVFERPMKDANAGLSNSDAKAACGFPALKGRENYNPEPLYQTEVYCQLQGTNSANTDYFKALYDVRQIMDKMGIPQNRQSPFPDQVDPEKIEGVLLTGLKQKQTIAFDSCSLGGMLGDKLNDQVKFIGMDGKDSVNLGSLLGTFSRLSVASQETNRGSELKNLDLARHKTCSAFHYDDKGILQFNKL